mgnify:CR=1 FL=1
MSDSSSKQQLFLAQRKRDSTMVLDANRDKRLKLFQEKYKQNRTSLLAKSRTNHTNVSESDMVHDIKAEFNAWKSVEDSDLTAEEAEMLLHDIMLENYQSESTIFLSHDIHLQPVDRNQRGTEIWLNNICALKSKK